MLVRRRPRASSAGHGVGIPSAFAVDDYPVPSSSFMMPEKREPMTVS